MTTVSIAFVVTGLCAGLLLMWRVPTVPPTTLIAGSGTDGRVTVVVPARNEATRLPRLLASLAAQTRRPDDVVVVDDDSTDDTAAVAERARAHVVRGSGPPPGAAGKAWACHVGTTAPVAVAADVVVLLDADVWLAPDAVARVLAVHHAIVPDGLLSVQPYHETQRPYEQLSAVANLVPVMASAMAAVRAPASAAVAFGPCLVTTPAALARAGGFAAVASETIEDVALARRYRAVGQSVRCLAGGDAVRFRMYDDGVRSLVQGWTKNLAGGARSTPWWSTLGASLWVTGALAAAGAAVVDRSLLGAGAWVLVAAQTAWMLRRIGRFRWWTSALFPIPVVAFVVFFVRSVVARGVRRSVVWKGRRVGVGG